MTAQKSTNNFVSNLLYRVKANKKTSIILLVLHLLSAPLVLINMIIYLIREQNYFEKYGSNYRANRPNFPYEYITIGTIATGIAVICGIFIAINVFNYLHKKSMVDMTLSLPLTTKQRFFSDFLAGLISYVGPFLVSTVITTIFSFTCQSAYVNSHIYNENWRFNKIMSIPEFMLKLTIFGFFIMIMVYVITVLALSYSGSLFEAVANTFALNLLIPGAIYMGRRVFLDGLFGINATDSVFPLIFKTSPLGGVIYIADNFIYNNEGQNPFTFWLIPFILVTAIFFGISYFLYTKRKAEDVSKPYVFKGFYHIMLTLIMFIIVAIFDVGKSTENIIPLIILSSIAWLIIEVITNRGFKKIWKSGIRYVITLGSLILILQISTETKGFGAVYKVPDANDVKSISINYGGVFTGDFDNYVQEVTLKDKNSIQAVIDMHEAVLDNYKDNGKNYTGYYSYKVVNIGITYHLKNGKTLKRAYNVKPEEYKLLSSIDLTDEYIDGMTKNLKNTMYDYIEEDFDLYLHIQYYIHRITNQMQFKSKSEIDEFISAINKDLKSLDAEEYYNINKDYLYIISVPNYDFYIDENFENTLEFLQNHDITI